MKSALKSIDRHLPPQEPPPSSLPGVAIGVLQTSAAGTLAALTSAAAFSGQLRPAIRLIGLEVVPYPLASGQSPRSLGFNQRRLEEFVAGAGVPARIETYLCRDRKQALRLLFDTPSILVVGGPRRWWRSREQRLARWLEGQGHQVIFVATP